MYISRLSKELRYSWPPGLDGRFKNDGFSRHFGGNGAEGGE